MRRAGTREAKGTLWHRVPRLLSAVGLNLSIPHDADVAGFLGLSTPKGSSHAQQRPLTHGLKCAHRSPGRPPSTVTPAGGIVPLAARRGVAGGRTSPNALCVGAADRLT